MGSFGLRPQDDIEKTVVIKTNNCGREKFF